MLRTTSRENITPRLNAVSPAQPAAIFLYSRLPDVRGQVWQLHYEFANIEQCIHDAMIIATHNISLEI
jgi:hypothetical protein